MEVAQLSDVHAILAPGITSCLVRRVPERKLLEAFVELSARGTTATAHGRVQRASLAQEAARLAHAFAPRALSTWLARDVATLCEQFMALSGGSACKVSLDVVRHDACRRFHHDYVPLRLLCTYAGPGTEYVPREHVSSDALTLLSEDIEQANRAIVPDPTTVLRAMPMDVLVLKGLRYPEHQGIGAVHRSPNLSGSGHSRVVLKIDEDAAVRPANA